MEKPDDRRVRAALAEAVEPLADVGAGRHALEASIGREVRAMRRQLNLTVVELARISGLSAGMLSKIENGITSPSLTTLHAIARALNMPLSALFERFDSRREATFTAHGQGHRSSEQPDRPGYRYVTLGGTRSDESGMQPYIVELSADAATGAVFRHAGTEFVHVLEGRMTYRHGDRSYEMGPGDSLYYDAEQPHGPDAILEAPVRVIVVIDGAGAA